MTIPSARASDALSVTDGTTTIGSIVIHDGSYFAFGIDDVLIGEFASQGEAMRSIPTASTAELKQAEKAKAKKSADKTS